MKAIILALYALAIAADLLALVVETPWMLVTQGRKSTRYVWSHQLSDRYPTMWEQGLKEASNF